MSEYNEFIKLYVQVHTSGSRKDIHANGQKMWNEIKKDKNKLQEEIRQLKDRLAKRKAANFFYWANLPKEKVGDRTVDLASASTPTDEIIIEEESEKTSELESVEAPDERKEEDNRRKAPSLGAVQKELADVNEEHTALSTLSQRGLVSDETKKRLETLVIKRNQLLKKKRKLVHDQKYQREKRSALKRKLEQIAADNPVAAKSLKSHMRKGPGHPKLEEDQVELRKTIVEILTPNSKADDRRRSVYCSTLCVFKICTRNYSDVVTLCQKSAHITGKLLKYFIISLAKKLHF